MITTDYVPGSPSWLDLGTPDVAAAAAFYGGVFGWELRPMGKNPSGYGAFLLEGRTAAAVGLLTEEGAVPAWTVYFTTTDAQATARAVVSAGGSVRVPPTKLGEEATFAQFSDPAGGQFAVFRPGQGRGGIEAVDEPGALVWVEYCTPDPAAAREFYGSVFGWQTDEMTVPGGGGSYTMLTPAGESQQRMHGGIAEARPEQLTQTGGRRPYWHPVFATADCDATAASVNAFGGTVRMAPSDAEGVGRLAVCADVAGAEFVLLTPAPM